MKQFINKLCIYIICLLTPLVLVYIVVDPFKIVKPYSWYYENGKPEGIRLNRGWVGYKTFSMHCDSCQWDSFIFGSSRSMNYSVNDWKKYIGENTRPYHFNAYGETLLGVNKRLHYAIEHSQSVKNCLIVLDRDLLSRTDPIIEDNLKNTPPALYGGSSLKFHYFYFHLFYSSDFLELYLPYIFRGRPSDLINTSNVQYIREYNEVSTEPTERLINLNSEDFYSEIYLEKHRFNKAQGGASTNSMEYEPVVMDAQKELLEDICRILCSNGIDFRIIVSPMYYGAKLNHQDLKVLKEIFSRERVFDFSSDALRFDYHNFYDAEHYRTIVADHFMEKAYSFDLE